MAKIHDLSFVASGAEVAADVLIGPYCYVESNAVIGPGCKLDSHVTIKGNTIIGKNNFFGQGSVIGGDPQDRKYKGEPTFLKIGDDNVFREYVTIHRASGEGKSTVIGNHCFLMAFCHVGHNGTLYDNVTMANSCNLSGHVTVEEFATIGGMVGIHQFARVGKIAMVGGFGKIVRDIPPFMLLDSSNGKVHDINAVGLRRMGVTAESRLAVHKACKLIFKSALSLTNALHLVKEQVDNSAEVDYLVQFMERLFKGKNGRGDQP